MAWFCQHCGKEIPEHSNFCRFCGGKQALIVSSITSTNAPTVAMIAKSFSNICPYCQTPVETNESSVCCLECGIVHHSECWNQNGGTCTTYGCKGKSPDENEIMSIDYHPI